jgi:hypothetical protein
MVRGELSLLEVYQQLRRTEKAMSDPGHGMETPEQEYERLTAELKSLKGDTA